MESDRSVIPRFIFDRLFSIAFIRSPCFYRLIEFDKWEQQKSVHDAVPTVSPVSFCRSSSKSKPRQFTFHPRAAGSGSVLLLSEPSANLLLNHLPLYNPTAGLSQADHFFSNWLVTV